MKKTLIIYSTTDGQTKRICDRIVECSGIKSEITLCEIENAPKIDLNQYIKSQKDLLKKELNKNLIPVNFQLRKTEKIASEIFYTIISKLSKGWFK